MKRTGRFGIDTTNRKSDATLSALTVDGVTRSTLIEGLQIVDQFEVEGGYLLLTDFNDPWEELTVVSLLDAEFNVLAKRQLGGGGLVFASKVFCVREVTVDGDALVVKPLDQDGQVVRIEIQRGQSWSSFRNPIKLTWLPPVVDAA